MAFIHADIRDSTACNRATRDVDVVVHLADEILYRVLPRSAGAVEVNVLGGMNLLESSRDNRVPRFIYASSSSVYGDDPRLPKREIYTPRPISPYAASKAAFEQLADAWSASWDISCTGLRLFKCLGPRQDPEGAYAAAVPRSISAALSGTRPVIYEMDQHAATSPTWITWSTRYVYARQSDADSPAILNVACGTATTVLDIWNIIAATTGCEVSPRFVAPRPGDMPASLADISAIQRLGYNPVLETGEGLRRTVSWFRDKGPRGMTPFPGMT